MSEQLHVYKNDTDWVIASSFADAVAVWEETYGEKWSDYAESQEGGWEMCDDLDEFTLFEEALLEPEHAPAGAVIIERGEYSTTTRATFGAWIAARGRGLLGSTEY